MENRSGYVMLDMLIFILVFSFFNDNFLVELIGENILKIIFLLFLVFCGHIMIKNIRNMNLLQDKLFFIFFIALLIIFLIHNIIGMSSDLNRSIFTLINISTIILFFSRYTLKKLLYFIWVSMMASVIICFFNDPINPWTFRTSGGTIDPNEFSAQLLAFIFTSIYLYNINKSKFFLSITVIFFIFGLFKAGSMSAFLMLGAISGLLMFKYLFYNYKSIFNYKLILFSLIIIVGVNQIDYSKIDALSNILNRSNDTHTARYRMDCWVAGQHMIESHTLVGVGINDFAVNTRKYAEAYIHAPAPHNLYIQLFAESGIIVFILFLIFIFTLLIQNFIIIKNKNEFWLLIAFISLLFMGMTLGIMYDKYFLLYIAIIMNVHNLFRNHLKLIPSKSDEYSLMGRR